MSATGLQKSGQRGAPTRRVVVVRRWLLLGFAVLASMLVTVLGLKRIQARHVLADLPRRLGLDIQSETNGFSYTQSIKGRVLFTVHAAKAIQRENGKTTLHDVSIAVHPTPGSDRPDSIRGEQFEYDQVNGVIKAQGVVHLDLAGPRSSAAEPRSGAARIDVTTSGLIFLQKLGVLATDQPLQFVYGELHGSARGADYETDTGLLRLRSDVQLDGLQQGKPVHMVVAAAEFDRTRRTGTLHMAELQIAADRGRGDRVIVTAANEGSPRVLEADGNVVLDGLNGEHLSASHVRANTDGSGHLQQLAAQGNVVLQDERYSATSGSALLHMNAAGRPLQAELTTAVHVSVAGKAGQGSSELKSPHAVFNLLDAGSHTELKDLSADGGAVLSSVEAEGAAQVANRSPLQKSGASPVTTLTARSLHADTAVANGVRYIATVEGKGGTKLEQSDSLGNRRVSSGDTLQAALLPAAASAATPRTQALLRSVVQTGAVNIAQHKVLPATQSSHGAAQVEDDHATAQQAEWDNVNERLRLTGFPVLTGPGIQLAADVIELSQKNSSTDAAGHVRGTFQRTETSNSDPVRVLAERCRINSDTGLAEFFGDTSPVRLWTSTSQLEAAEVDLKKAEGLLVAHSTAQASQSGVRLLLSEESSSPSSHSNRHGTIQVHGQTLTITAGSGQMPTRIVTSGDVRVTAQGSDVRANRVVATMNPSQVPGAKVSAPSSAIAGLMPGGGSLQSVAASGDVRLQQPGKTARGQDLLYTAKEDEYRLSGKPAFLHDSLRGDLTGQTLTFHGGNERAEVAGEVSRPVHTELPAPTGRAH